jgi:predicted acetyltransferase
MAVELVEPGVGLLPGYVAALEAGWSPNTGRDVSGEHLAAIHADADAFIRDLARHEGGFVTDKDGTRRPRLPGRVFWIWDGEFCGAINLRFVPGSEELPPHVSGHVGYAIVPWKRNRGYARQALGLLLAVAGTLGMPRVLITCDDDNDASRRVIEACGGEAAGTSFDPEHFESRKLLYWVSTEHSASSAARSSG